jgi:hypothetical protein
VRPYRAAAALAVVLASLATAQVAILQIQIVEGDGGIYAPGARSARPLVVAVTDETGRPVAGAAVSFHLPEDGPSGIFGNGLRTDVVLTDDRGRAILRSMQLNRTPGRFAIRIIASKEQVTAGTVSSQYIADPASEADAAKGEARETDARPDEVTYTSLPPPSFFQRHLSKKWLLILAAAGAGAAAAVLAAHSIGKGSSSSTAASTGASVPPTIGTPSITVGVP